MLAENLEIAKQWVAKAHNDLLNADNNLQAQWEIVVSVYSLSKKKKTNILKSDRIPSPAGVH